MTLRTSSLWAALGLLSLGSLGAADPAVDRAVMAKHGMETLGLIQQRFSFPTAPGYAEAIHPADPAFKTAPADAWACGVQLTALTAAAKLDRDKYLPDLRHLVDALDDFRSDVNGINGYDDGPHPKPPDRYYDDNAWLVLGFLEAYEVTQDPKDLDRAKAALAFTLSGEDQQLGGGLFWRELAKTSKNTCSNAPAIAATVRMYTFTHDSAQLATAVRLYRWTKANLQDKDDLYFDNLTLDRKLSKFKWTYNTALMIRAGCLLYGQTHDEQYLKDAQRTAAAARDKWVNARTGALKDPAKFGHLLAEAFLDLSARDHDPQWAAIDYRAVTYGWDHNRDPAGFHPEHWDRAVTAPLSVAALIDQASAARASLRAAWPEATPTKP